MRKIVIIGGVAGGATAATRLRRLSEETEIIVFERGGYVSFANCGLPYHIGGVIPDRKQLLLQSPESFRNRYNVDVRVGTEVLEIDRNKKTVLVRNLTTLKEYSESYETLLLSPGAEPFLPPIEGLTTGSYHFLRSMEDMDGVNAEMKHLVNKSALVIGGGFIGMEIVENLIEANVKTYLVERNAQVMANVDYEIAVRIHHELVNNGVKLFLNNGVERIERTETGHKVTLANRKVLHVGMIIVATGVKPRAELAIKAGLKIGSTGGIQVDEYLQTSDPSIFAVGDAIELKHLINDKKVLLPLAWLSNRQGRIVADNIMGVNPKKIQKALGTSIAKIFDLSVASTGLNERFLKQNGIQYKVATVDRLDHAGYYPGASAIILKMLFDGHGNILGAQGIGAAGIDKRIDVLATAIINGMKVQDLQELELSYAPPYNSAKDPVNILGYLAANMLDKSVETVNYDELDALLENPSYAMLDVRTKEEYAEGAIHQAININVDELRQNLHKLDKNKTYIVYCRVGFRSYLAYRILINSGYKALNLTGGYTLWEPIQTFYNFHNYVGIQIAISEFTIANFDGNDIEYYKKYPLTNTGIETFLTDCVSWGVDVETTLFATNKNVVSAKLISALYERGAKIWQIGEGQIGAVALSSVGQNAILLAQFAANNAAKAKFFAAPRNVEEELKELNENKLKLKEAQLVLANIDSQFNGQKNGGEGTIASIERGLSFVDSKITTLWSLID